MENLFGEPYTELPKKQKPINKERRALNAMCREKRIAIDYSDRNFERWF